VRKRADTTQHGATSYRRMNYHQLFRAATRPLSGFCQPNRGQRLRHTRAVRLLSPSAHRQFSATSAAAFSSEEPSPRSRPRKPYWGFLRGSQSPRRLDDFAVGVRQRGRRQLDVVLQPTEGESEVEGDGLHESRGCVSTEQEMEEDPQSSDNASSTSTFQSLGLDDLVTAQLGLAGITSPTAVQERAIPAVLTGRNTAIASYTGSGKTLAYMLPAVQLAISQAEKLLLNAKPEDRARLGPTCVVVAPSRELAMQIVNVARQILPAEAKQAVQQLIGGANGARQEEALKKHQPLIVVGTPGRLAEHSRKGTLATHHTGVLIMDEADQLLAPNFREDMVRLTQHVGKRAEGGRQTVIVSATLTPGVLKSAYKWCPDPEIVFLQPGMPQTDGPVRNSPRVPSDGQPAWGWGMQAGGVFSKESGSSAAGVGNQDSVPDMPPSLSHAYVVTPHRHKVDSVRRTLYALGAERALIFMNFQQRIKDTQAKLQSRGMSVGGLHGELSALDRRNILQAFRNGKYRALIVSDVAARGLDIQGCDAVINLELPSEATHYAHRAGRTGRAGREGAVVSIVSAGEAHVIHKMANRLKIGIEERELSHGELRPVRSSSEVESDSELEEVAASSVPE